MSLFRDEAPVLDATKTRADDLAQVATAGAYAVFNQVHANVGVFAMSFPGFVAASTSQVLTTLPYPASLVGVVVRFGTASSSGTLQIEETPSGTAVGSGTNLLTTTVSLAGTPDTNTFGVVANIAGGASGFPGNTIPAGNSISAVIAGTKTSLANCTITLYLVRAAIK